MTQRFSGRVFLTALTFAIVLFQAVQPDVVARLGPGSGGREYQYFRVGSSSDVQTPTRAGLVLEGGGRDIDESFEWMIDRSGGGDFLIIRASGTDAYNPYIAEMTTHNGRRANSVATLIIPNRAAATDPFVVETIGKAEAIWIAGGNQARYVAQWKGSPVVTAIHAAVARGVPVGGTSSGLAVMGGILYSAANDPESSNDLVSWTTLIDPFNPRVTLDHDFLSLTDLGGAILDSHFVQKNRMGRMVSFLGRISEHGWAPIEARGIGVERKTALLVEPDGRATVIGYPGYKTAAAYFVRLLGRARVCRPGAPLDARDVEVVRLVNGESFDLRSWRAAGGLAYTVSAGAGRLSSSHPEREVYGYRRRSYDREKLVTPMPY